MMVVVFRAGTFHCALNTFKMKAVKKGFTSNQKNSVVESPSGTEVFEESVNSTLLYLPEKPGNIAAQCPQNSSNPSCVAPKIRNQSKSICRLPKAKTERYRFWCIQLAKVFQFLPTI